MVSVLAKRWITAKDMIKSLEKELIEIEVDLLKEVESVEGGSKTSHLDGYKIVVKRPINRTIDPDKWEEVKGKIPESHWPIKVKISPDDKGCTWLAENHPELWAVAAEAITEKAGKPGFTIEEETTND